MNFLAHIYLSNNDNKVAIGNFISDSIRGKNYKKYPKAILLGKAPKGFMKITDIILVL